MKSALVNGAGGFIGGHLVKRLHEEGFWVRGVDLKRPEFSESAADDFIVASGESHTVADFVATAFRRIGVTDWRALVDVDPRFQRPVDPPEQRGDSCKARRELGWCPSKSFEDMVNEMVDADLRLIDYKVRILNPQAATDALTRVMIESADSHGERWSTVGVSTNVIDASYAALHDSITYKLQRDGA